MAIRSFQRSIRFTNNEWDAVVEAAEKAGIAPGSFVRKAAARAAADDLYLYGGGLTPELADLIQRTHRAVHLLTYVKRRPDHGARRRPIRRKIVAPPFRNSGEAHKESVVAAAIDASNCVSVADPGQPLAPAALPVVLPDPAHPLLVGEHGEERAPPEDRLPPVQVG